MMADLADWSYSFNVTAATTWFTNHAEGLPYGFANILTGWIDTAEDNYPGNLDAKVHEVGSRA